jgi:hypothetical protein
LGLPEDGVYQEKPDGSILTVKEGSKPKSRRLSTEEVTAFGLDPTGVYEIDATDKISTIQQPKDPNSDLARTKLKLEVMDKVNGEKFRTLTKAEKAEMGLPADGAFQIDEKTQKVFPISSGNTNIRVDAGTIPAGYKAVRDEQGNILSIEPLPGTARRSTDRHEERHRFAGYRSCLVLPGRKGASVDRIGIDAVIAARYERQSALRAVGHDQSERILRHSQSDAASFSHGRRPRIGY